MKKADDAVDVDRTLRRRTVAVAWCVRYVFGMRLHTTDLVSDGDCRRYDPPAPVDLDTMTPHILDDRNGIQVFRTKRSILNAVT